MMVINKNNLKHTWTRVPLLLLHRLSSFFFSFLFRNCSETRPPERLHPRPLRAPSAIGAIPRSVACPRSMLLSSAAPLGSPSRQSLFSTVSPLSATNDLCFLRFLSLRFPFFFFFFLIRWPYTILNFSRIFVIHSIWLQFYRLEI